MAWSTVNFRIFQLQGWLELLHHWARQKRGGTPGGSGPQARWSKGKLKGEGGEREKGWEKCLNSYLAPIWAHAKGI